MSVCRCPQHTETGGIVQPVMRPIRLQGALALGLCALPACWNGAQPSGSSSAAAPTSAAAATSANREASPGDAPGSSGGLPVLATNAPKDKPISASGSRMDELRKGMAPLIEKARQTYPDAKKRYLAGLPRGEGFFVTTSLRDARGATEQVFIAVSGIQGAQISGKIASDIRNVQGFQHGQAYSLDEADLIDWLISKPDGSEEGNLIGKYIDSIH